MLSGAIQRVVIAAVVLCGAALVLETQAYDYDSKYMMSSSGRCNTGTTMVQWDEAGYFRLKSSSAAYSRNLKCTVTLDAGLGNRLYVQFDTIDMSTGDSLSMYSGQTTSSAYLGSVSGTYTSFTARTSGRYLTLSFNSYNNNYYHTGFNMIYTLFQSEPCIGDLDFECENDYCISSELTCDFINNCGDNSDEGDESDCFYFWNAGAVVGVIIAVLAAIALVIGGIVCCCVCAARSSYRAPRYQTIVHSGSGSQPGYPAAGYGSTAPPPGLMPAAQTGYPPPHYQQYPAATDKTGVAFGAQPPPYQQHK